jgi:hypothetical protein
MSEPVAHVSKNDDGSDGTQYNEEEKKFHNLMLMFCADKYSFNSGIPISL